MVARGKIWIKKKQKLWGGAISMRIGNVSVATRWNFGSMALNEQIFNEFYICVIVNLFSFIFYSNFNQYCPVRERFEWVRNEAYAREGVCIKHEISFKGEFSVSSDGRVMKRLQISFGENSIGIVQGEIKTFRRFSKLLHETKLN